MTVTGHVIHGRHRAPTGGSTRRPAAGRRRRVVRRGLDLLVATSALLLLAVPMLVVALLVRATSPGPALFRQVRVGEHRRPFGMLKFRTMQLDCSDDLHRAYVTRELHGEGLAGENGVHKLDADPRVTRLGRVLRRTSIDELPQLINVLRGEMSLVGPRPMLPWECDLLRPDHRDRFSVPAGMTGLWQVSGRSALSMTEALDLDVHYARHAGLLVDLAILVRTVWVVLVPRGRAQ
ncbi:sugar transferase [Actinomycetospora lutea]|uniref:sugar transferase n=1 Tax=Actinomycetospora lutea TaxID=663604 RepID=UPI0023664CC5|nr:sugar transferase [Actinomycetospora lutea]MDD7942003.1 sugar transferase [Actinomycetospora lutea]